MNTFCFDVGGVIIRDNLAPDNAWNVFRELSKHYQLNPEEAFATYLRLQPSLDLGTTSLSDLCSAIGLQQEQFEQYWLSIHAPDCQVIAVVEQLLSEGHQVGLATNMCRRLLDLLIGRTPVLAQTEICCSSDIGAVKPSRTFFSRAAEMIGTRKIVFIDDRQVNIDAAREFGWTVIHARDNWLAQFRLTYLSAT